MDNKVKVIIIVFIAIIFGLLIFSYIKGGTVGLMNAISIIVKWLFWLMVLGIIIGIGYYLFLYEKKVDISYEVYKDIIDETKLNNRHNLSYLWITGDENHTPKRIGKIIGFAKRQNYDYINHNGKNYYVNESIFRVRRVFDNPILNIISYFFFKKIIIRCPEYLHDNLQGDVYIKCVSLVKHRFFYYPDTIHQNMRAIDRTILYESMRYLQLKSIKAIDNLVMKGMGVSYFDKKELEGMKGIEILRKETQSLKGEK